MKIYVASSWRNFLQPEVVMLLRNNGHNVYDFKNPSPGNKGFAWQEIDELWKTWSPAMYRDALQHHIARAGYKSDIDALSNCEACLLVLPSGRSASWEFGYAYGKKKRCAVFMTESCEPELMYSDCKILVSWDELKEWSVKL